MGLAYVKALAKSINMAGLVKAGVVQHAPKRQRIVPRAYEGVTAEDKRTQERALNRFARDWSRQHAWERVVEHAGGWDGKGRMVSIAKVFTERKKR